LRDEGGFVLEEALPDFVGHHVIVLDQAANVTRPALPRSLGVRHPYMGGRFK
jgi:hypothetical protein